jgi:polysaccharide pyruvyl transferase WcaK-like protein
MKKICIWGTSLKKVADEAQLIAVSRIIKSRIPDAQITTFSRFGQLLTQIMAKENIASKTIRTSNISRVMYALASSDMFVIVGGPLFEAPLQAITCLMLFSFAKIFRRPVITYGMTVFPFKTWWGRFLFRNIFNRIDAITIREKVGLNILNDLGVKKDVFLFADPRFILEPVPSDKVRSILIKEGVDPDEPFISISTRYLHQNVPTWVKRSHYYTNEGVQNANEIIARVAAYLGGLAQVLIIPMHPSYREDMEMANVISKYMRVLSRLKMLSRTYSALEIMGIINQSQLLIASRLGSAVFATVTGTPIISIAYELRMMDHMERIRLSEYVFDWKELKYEDLVAKINEVWLSRDTIKAYLKSQVKGFRELACNNAEFLNRFV